MPTSDIPDFHPTQVVHNYIASCGWLGGIHIRIKFPNGYGASIIKRIGSIGFPRDLWELAVTKGRFLTFSTPITNDVIGSLTEDEVRYYLSQIEVLPKEIK